MITITGKLIGCGAITTYDAVGRGLELEVEGETVYLLGLTIEQCQQLSHRVSEAISITIDVPTTPCLAETVTDGWLPRCAQYPNCPCGGPQDTSCPQSEKP